MNLSNEFLLAEKNVPLEKLDLRFFTHTKIEINILRTDLLHPIISGNKWYKLKHNILQANKENKTTILSFGGAYSNHLHALAYSGHMMNIETIGIVRGEEVSNATLLDCKRWGMQLIFVDRQQYRNRNEKEYIAYWQKKFPMAYIVPEGGGNALGVLGATEILQNINLDKIKNIVCPVGTGTTLAGILACVPKHVKVWGVAAIKNGAYLKDAIKQYTMNNHFTLLTEYHFGGFAKTNFILNEFVTSFLKTTLVPLDKVYNAKAMFALVELYNKNVIDNNSNTLYIHTGGLQGNRN